MFIIILAALVVVLISYFIGQQRRFVFLEENVDNSLANISVNLNSRWDALKALAKAVKTTPIMSTSPLWASSKSVDLL